MLRALAARPDLTDELAEAPARHHRVRGTLARNFAAAMRVLVVAGSRITRLQCALVAHVSWRPAGLAPGPHRTAGPDETGYPCNPTWHHENWLIHVGTTR
jgi:hypothetical protein